MQEHKCDFCDKTFVRPASLSAHCCAKKMRWLDKDTKIGCMAFAYFEKFHAKISSYNKKYTTTDFINSPLYNAFYNFARWVNDSELVKPWSYLDWLINQSVHIDAWCQDAVYERFVHDMNVHEPVQEALHRSLEFMAAWCEQRDLAVHDFFRCMSVNVLVDMLRCGHVSPWMIFACPSSAAVIQDLDDLHWSLLGNLLNHQTWAYKISRCKEFPEYCNMMKGIDL